MPTTFQHSQGWQCHRLLLWCHSLVSILEAPKGFSGLGKAEPKEVFLHQPLEDISGSHWLCLELDSKQSRAGVRSEGWG